MRITTSRPPGRRAFGARSMPESGRRSTSGFEARLAELRKRKSRGELTSAERVALRRFEKYAPQQSSEADLRAALGLPTIDEE
jgi:hypothetical protein